MPRVVFKNADLETNQTLVLEWLDQSKHLSRSDQSVYGLIQNVFQQIGQFFYKLFYADFLSQKLSLRSPTSQEGLNLLESKYHECSPVFTVPHPELAIAFLKNHDDDFFRRMNYLYLIGLNSSDRSCLKDYPAPLKEFIQGGYRIHSSIKGCSVAYYTDKLINELDQAIHQEIL